MLDIWPPKNTTRTNKTENYRFSPQGVWCTSWRTMCNNWCSEALTAEYQHLFCFLQDQRNDCLLLQKPIKHVSELIVLVHLFDLFLHYFLLHVMDFWSRLIQGEEGKSHEASLICGTIVKASLHSMMSLTWNNLVNLWFSKALKFPKIISYFHFSSAGASLLLVS